MINAFSYYFKAKMHNELYQEKIKFAQYLLNLIYYNVSSFYQQRCFGAKYHVIFSKNNYKTLKVILFFNKNEKLTTFDLF